MQSKSLATGTEFPTILVPKPQPANNPVPLYQKRCRLVSILKAGKPLWTS